MVLVGIDTMTRASSSILLGLFTLTASYAAHTASAQACSCLRPEVTRNYAEADRVFRGQVIWSLALGGERNYYLVRPEQAYKGCLDQYNWEWITTSASSAACGASFSNGESYLFFTDQDRRVTWSQTTSSCHGNRVFSSLNDEELKFLNTRYNCCGEDCGCADGSPQVNCLVDPCEVTEPCDTDKALTCVANYCGGCNAEFLDEQGALACQRGARCALDGDCKKGEYCGTDGLCVDVGSCTQDYECNLPGNNFNNSKRCLGYGECKANRCEYKCGDPRCVNHEGFDFGDCEMLIGVVRVGDECKTEVGGCGSLIPSGTGGFANKEECEQACKPTTFACGKSLRCELGTEYCIESIPGVAPEPGDSVESNFDCTRFPVACSGVPSCEKCIKPGPFGGLACEDEPSGAVYVTVPMP